ncbi:MAG TPA: hypothetical protein PKL31_06805 [Fulvivirga sp.]|nr:hypothetical protein [Fulvivirga sp.]
MKTKFRTLLAFSAAALIAIGPIQAQEYDDMYFTPKDRAAKNKDKVEKVAQVEDLQSNFDPQESYSQKNVNPDYIAKYSANSYEDESGYAEDEYYIDDYNDNYSQPIANNYYNSGYRSYYNPGMVYSPRWGWYDPFYGPSLYSSPGWSFSIGFGTGWGYNRFGRLSYGSSWGSYYGYYDSWYPSSYYGYYGYYDPFYYPYRNNIVVINNYESRSNRTYKRSVGPSRGDSRITDRNSSGTRSRVVSNNGDNSGRTTGRVSSTDSDNSRNRYSESVNSRSSYYRRSRVTNEVDNSATNSRSSYSRSSVTPRSNSSYGNSRSTRPSSYSTPPSNRSRTYNSNSGSRSRSYTSPSPAPSRSRSSGNVGSSPSRSSGSGNRVSTGSSPSRSSGSRSSSGSSRKRGN